MAEAGEEALKDEINKQKDALEAEANEKIDEGKEIAKEKVDAVVDSANTVIKENVDKVKAEAKDKAEELLKEKLGSSAGTLIDSTANNVLKNAGTQNAVDSIKNHLNKFNPFKKKKKKN